jgi:hypothetical protein
MDILTLEFPVYNSKLYVIQCEDIQKGRDELNTVLGPTIIHKDCDGLCSWDDEICTGEFWIHILPSTSTGVIAHEVWHFIYRMFKQFGIKIDNENVAYHLSYTIDEILEWKTTLQTK